MSLLPTLEDPRLLPMLPAIYIAWADGELSADEMRSLCAHVDGITGIDVECRQALGDWLNGAAPPRPAELSELLAAIRRLAGGLEHPERMDLATLAAELVHTGRPGIPLRAPEARAIAEIEAVLGIIGPEAAVSLLDLTRQPAVLDDGPAFEPTDLGAYLDGSRADIRNRVRRLLAQPRFNYRVDIARDDYREVVLAWTKELAERGIGPIGYPFEYGGESSMSCFIAAFTVLGHHDLSLLTKFGVQFGLFGGSLERLGTKRHHDAYCFALTADDHGSNVRALETLAVYSSAAD
jgi:acyl-CoA oxidase